MCFKVNLSTVRFLSVALLLLLMSRVALAQQVVTTTCPVPTFRNITRTGGWTCPRMFIPIKSWPRRSAMPSTTCSRPRALRSRPVTKPTLTSVINAPLTRNGSGAPGPWAVVCAGGGGMGTAMSSTITNGMLAVDFYDPTSQQLIWRGTAAETLNPSGNPQKRHGEAEQSG